jgi:hypothetical protein
VTGVGLWGVKYLANDGKKARWNRDLWDRVRIFLGFIFCFLELVLTNL